MFSDSKPSVPEAEVEAVAKPARVRELSGSNALSESSGEAHPYSGVLIMLPSPN